MATAKKTQTDAQRIQAHAKKKEKRDLTAVLIAAGIIMLLDENGKTVYYRQRGISNISAEDKGILIRMGLLHKDWALYKELPREIRIHYEDEFIMGRASATFPKKILDIIH